MLHVPSPLRLSIPCAPAFLLLLCIAFSPPPPSNSSLSHCLPTYTDVRCSGMAALRGIRTRWVRNQVRRKWPFPSRAARAGKQRDVIRSMCPLSSCCPRCQSMYLSACLLSCVFLCVSTVCVLSVQLSSPLSARYVSLVKPNSSDRVHTRVPLHLLLHLNDTWLLKLILILKVVYMWDI